MTIRDISLDEQLASLESETIMFWHFQWKYQVSLFGLPEIALNLQVFAHRFHSISGREKMHFNLLIAEYMAGDQASPIASR